MVKRKRQGGQGGRGRGQGGGQGGRGRGQGGWRGRGLVGQGLTGRGVLGRALVGRGHGGPGQGGRGQGGRGQGGRLQVPQLQRRRRRLRTVIFSNTNLFPTIPIYPQTDAEIPEFTQKPHRYPSMPPMCQIMRRGWVSFIY